MNVIIRVEYVVGTVWILSMGSAAQAERTVCDAKILNRPGCEVGDFGKRRYSSMPEVQIIDDRPVVRDFRDPPKGNTSPPSINLNAPVDRVDKFKILPKPSSDDGTKDMPQIRPGVKGNKTQGQENMRLRRHRLHSSAPSTESKAKESTALSKAGRAAMTRLLNNPNPINTKYVGDFGEP